MKQLLPLPNRKETDAFLTLNGTYWKVMGGPYEITKKMYTSVNGL